MRPTFALGLGAQKAGTTWLYRYLRGSPEFVHGYRKEYSVFDALDVPLQGWRMRRNLDLAAAELDKLRRGESTDGTTLHRASMYGDQDIYFDYFAGLLRSRPDARLAADLTPDYALLRGDRLVQIKEAFATRGVRTVGIFLMRDPVDRIWSQIRMEHGRDPERFPKPPELMVRELAKKHSYAARSRYQRTFEAAEAAFARDELHYGFYEELFDESSVRAICRVAGIEFRQPNFERRVNASVPRAVRTLPEEVVAEVAGRLADSYRAVAERFPDKDVTKIWPSAHHVL